MARSRSSITPSRTRLLLRRDQDQRGGYSWTESGSSDATKFTATANKNSGAVSAIFLTGAPEDGQKISIAYDHNSDGVGGALSRGGQAWLELVVGGETLIPRERLVAVPFAHLAKDIILKTSIDSLLGNILSLLQLIDILVYSHIRMTGG